MSLNEQTLAEHLRLSEKALSHDWGAFTLFGLFELEDTPGRWDLIASASWLTANLPTIQQFVDGLQPYLKAEEWSQIRQIVPLRPDEPFVQAMLRLLKPAAHDLWETGPLFTADYRVSRALIITAAPVAILGRETRDALLAS
jgi:hypothetical protein